MYLEYYRLNQRPFATAPDPDFMFWADPHTMAFTMLRYGVMMRAPITVLTGEIGAGKTTLLRQLLREVPGDLEVGLISNMQAGRGDLLHWALSSLGEPLREGESYVASFRRLQDRLIDAYSAGRRVILVFDEAQNLGDDTLEELRMLSNINADGDDLLQMILVGQPQLRAQLQRPSLAQFAQRISADFHLEGLGAAETERYIEHRLTVAGASWRIFTSGACAMAHEAARGTPRLINVLCDLCLVYGFAADEKVVDETLVREFLDGARARGLYEQFSALDGPQYRRRQVV